MSKKKKNIMKKVLTFVKSNVVMYLLNLTFKFHNQLLFNLSIIQTFRMHTCSNLKALQRRLILVSTSITGLNMPPLWEGERREKGEENAPFA